MTDVTIFRPGRIRSRASFEAQAKLYEFLQSEYDYRFTIVIGESDEFERSQLDIQKIPNKAWKPVLPRLPVYPRKLSYRSHVDPHLESADAVITLDPTTYPQGFLALRRADRLGIPALVEASATLNGDLPLLRTIKKPLEMRSMNRANGIVVTVPKVIERFRDRGLYSSEIARKFHLLGHPVDTELFSFQNEGQQEGPINIITVSRLVPEKGLDYLLTALAPILRNRPDAEFDILGEGPMEAYVRRRSVSLSIDESVNLLGSVPHDEVPDALRKADIYVSHPVANSQWEEFFGVSNLEAMACGLPVVLSRCGGIPYVVRSEDVATFVDQRDVLELRAAIAELIESPELRKSRGEQARKFVEKHYSITEIAEKFDRAIQSTLERTS